jgi:CubicO group peptidase (beta-lactamase class C family)
VAIALSDLLPPGADTTSLQGISKLGGRMGFGAGGSVYVSDATGRESKGTWGWGGAAGTLGWIDPVRKIRATLMVNYFPAEQYPVRDEITRAVYANPAP